MVVATGSTWTWKGSIAYRIMDLLADPPPGGRPDLAPIEIAIRLVVHRNSVDAALGRLKRKGLAACKEGRWSLVPGSYCEDCLGTEDVAWKDTTGVWLCLPCRIDQDIEVSGGFR